MTVKPVKIKLVIEKKRIKFARMREFFDIEEGELDFLDEDGFCGPTTVFETSGTMSCEGGVIKIVYEMLMSDMTKRTECGLVFNEEEPTAVSMVKSGVVNESFILDSEKRRGVCVCNDGLFSSQLTVFTERLSNEITYERGGKLEVKYKIELRGIPVEGCYKMVHVTPL